jgi:RNA polymerase sigma factor (TIGR02999 family)
MEITKLLQGLQDGGGDAMNAVIPLVYENLKNLARSHLRREMNPLRLETTALVHEAFLRLARGKHPSYENRVHFYGIASKVMRQVLVDAARKRAAGKRSAAQEVALDVMADRIPDSSEPMLVVEDALQRLEKWDPVKLRIVEMRFFGGMTAEETAQELSLPVRTVRRELRLAHAWLRKAMTTENTQPCSAGSREQFAAL